MEQRKIALSANRAKEMHLYTSLKIKNPKGGISSRPDLSKWSSKKPVEFMSSDGRQIEADV